MSVEATLNERRVDRAVLISDDEDCACDGDSYRIDILSGTSSRPLSAMIAVDFEEDHKRLARDLVSAESGVI
jgi:hypothetical protein